jgi:hypothetical protein
MRFDALADNISFMFDLAAAYAIPETATLALLSLGLVGRTIHGAE